MIRDYINGFWLVVFAWLLWGCGAPCGSIYDPDTGTDADGAMCESHIVRDISVSSSFNWDQINAITGAGARWMTATDGRVQLKWRIVDGPADISPGAPDTPGALADARTRIRILPTVTPEQLRSIAAHELGHTFGLGHVDDPAQVMFPNPTSDITAADVAHFDRIWSTSRCGAH